MRRLIPLALLLVAAVPPASAKAPGRMLVTAREWSLVTSRQVLPAGTAIVQLANAGEDGHDLVVRRLSKRLKLTGRAVTFSETSPGDVSQRTFKLRAGRWKLWCSLPGHEAAGMRATIRVR